MLLSTEYTFLALLVIILLLTVWILLLERKLTRFLRGGKTKTLEESVMSLEQEVKTAAQFRKDMEEYLRGVEKRLKKSVQGIHTVRFQAFKGIGDGGSQSFASAFVNEKGDGVVISSIYSRDLVGIYAKPISNNKATFELTIEEKQALEQAIAEVKK